MDLPVAPRLFRAETFLSALHKPNRDPAPFERLNTHLSGGRQDTPPGDAEITALEDAWDAACRWATLSGPEQLLVNAALTRAGLPALEATR